MQGSISPTVIALVGPTASGKTSLGLWLAQELQGEIIACDSRTVYVDFDIGTAKPTLEERLRIKHHLIDVVSPNDNYTMAQFSLEGKAAIESILAAGKLPIVVGGTGLYARGLLEGFIIPQVAAQEDLRAELRTYALTYGNQALHARLKQVDAASAAKLNANDLFRIIRALEVFAVTGSPISQVAQKQEPPYKTIWIGLTANDRQVIHQSIKERFKQQLSQGLLTETEALLKRYGANQKMLHTVNYKQLVQYIAGSLDLQQAHEQAVQHNVQLARRQLMWFKANKSIAWFAVDAFCKADLQAAVLRHIKDAIQE